MSECGCYDVVVFGHACRPPLPAPVVVGESWVCPCSGCVTRRQWQENAATADTETRAKKPGIVGRIMGNYTRRGG